MMENLRCTIKEFKKDITDLCDTCPIRSRIAHELKKYDSFIKDKKRILSANEFEKYLTEEIKDLGKKMEQAIISNDASNRVPEGITEVYIGNKEIIKLLTTFEENYEPPTFKFPPLPDGLFKVLAVLKFTEKENSMIESGIYIDNAGRWKGTVKELASFIWVLKEKKYFQKNCIDKITENEINFFTRRYQEKRSLKEKTKPSLRDEKTMKAFIIPDLI